MPFQITTQPFGTLPTATATEPLTEYILEHTETGEFITVLPEYGGILRRLVLRKGQFLLPLLSAPDSPQALLTDESYSSALLYPFPSRIRHGIYHFEGEDYALKMNEIRRDNALHGFVHGRPFSVISQDVTPTYAQLVLRYDYDGDTAGYPFPFALTVSYKLIQGNQLLHGSMAADDRMCALEVAYSVVNTGSKRSPSAFGWHPYFTLADQSVDEMSLTLPGRSSIILDEKMIPSGRQPAEQAGVLNLNDQQLDTAFAIEPTSDSASQDSFAETVLTSLSTGVRLIVGQQTGPGKLNYLVCFTPTRRDSIAIEPLTANVDSFNNGDGLTILNPGEAMSGTIWVRLD
ncbi:aldose 1-epimerase [Spirosoma linguale]|uniref:Aldose 1-epimerase n=1 Tax=Spirosoma linguale (strain ATCC 33905 / DSM 74 / LMG 10896 / Claus 1) TaxID=504472 RepID=D2QLB0_SPILD|nr:Aldose 1-epimerase [Spirosoma linguale DSM 74]